MKNINAEKKKVQRIAVGTSELFSNFYEGNLTNNTLLPKETEDLSCELYTTTLNIAELYHLIQEKEGSNTEKFSKIFEEVYNKIKSCIHIEKYCLKEDFEEEYAKNYTNQSIFSFSLAEFCKDNNITNIL